MYLTQRGQASVTLNMNDRLLKLFYFNDIYTVNLTTPAPSELNGRQSGCSVTQACPCWVNMYCAFCIIAQYV